MKHDHQEGKTTRMNNKRHGVVTLITFIFFISTITAQESVNSTGGNATGSGGSTSYSIGQVVYTTNTGTNGSVAQGVQQPYEISIITGIEDAESISHIVSVYPNPTTDYLTLEMVGDLQTQYTAFLYDLNGQLLLETKITSDKTDIPTSILVPTTYFLKIVRKGDAGSLHEVETFKIIKN